MIYFCHADDNISGERLRHILLLIPDDRYRRSCGKVVDLPPDYGAAMFFRGWVME